MLKKIVNIITSRKIKRTLYADLNEAGGLANALEAEFKKMKSLLNVGTEWEGTKHPFNYAKIKHGNKFCQIYLAAHELLYLPDFWKEGVCLAHGKTNSLEELAHVLDFWLCHDVTTALLSEKFDFVSVENKASAFDENNKVAYSWKQLVKDPILQLHDFAQLASKDEVLSTLYPYTSLYTLCFSRCTGYPYSSKDLPNVTPIQHSFTIPNGKGLHEHKPPLGGDAADEQLYVVATNRTNYLGKGNAIEALKLVKENLPQNIKPAVKGTADDLLEDHFDE